MKRLWLVLLSLGMVMVFSVSAFAVDVKVGADYNVGGLYLNKISLADDSSSPNPARPFSFRICAWSGFCHITQPGTGNSIWRNGKNLGRRESKYRRFWCKRSGTLAEAENISSGRFMLIILRPSVCSRSVIWRITHSGQFSPITALALPRARFSIIYKRTFYRHPRLCQRSR